MLHQKIFFPIVPLNTDASPALIWKFLLYWYYDWGFFFLIYTFIGLYIYVSMYIYMYFWSLYLCDLSSRRISLVCLFLLNSGCFFPPVSNLLINVSFVINLGNEKVEDYMNLYILSDCPNKHQLSFTMVFYFLAFLFYSSALISFHA